MKRVVEAVFEAFIREIEQHGAIGPMPDIEPHICPVFHKGWLDEFKAPIWLVIKTDEET